MNHIDTASLCDIIDITLYKFNHYDNLIWTKCLNQVDYTQIDEDSILVTPYQLQMMLNLNFKRDLMKIRAITFDLIHTDANSLYFLDKILGDFTRLKWIKLTLSKTRNFSRTVKINENATQIKYSFKIVKATFRLNEIFEDAELKKINPILHKYDLIPRNKPYQLQPAVKILNALDAALNHTSVSDNDAELLAIILDALSFKIENDNPDILLVTDW
jgi:hypothetical protein